MSNIKKVTSTELAGKDVNDIVSLVDTVYKKNGLHTELELQFIQLKINADPALTRAAKVNPESLYLSILQAAESGLSLNPQWQEGYFVPYNMKIDGKDVPTVIFSPMYRGKKKLLISKEIVKNITTELVYDGEFFDENIINGIHTITHKPDSFNRENPAKIVGGYAIITLNSGEPQYVVKGREYFERCKKQSENKMGGKTSPAWREWYDQMCLKCLVNAADSVIPKIGVNSDTTQLLNDLNTNDVDYVDVSNQKEIEETTKKPEKKEISSPEFDKLISDLKAYDISLKASQQKYKAFKFSSQQIEKIKEAGTIDDMRLTEIIEMIISDVKPLAYFEFYLNKEQFEIAKNAMIDQEINKQK